MMTIWKFEVNPEIEMPQDAVILSAQPQNGIPYIWSIVDDAKPKVTRRFRLAGTGRREQANFPAGEKYIATWQDPPFVWHLFEVL